MESFSTESNDSASASTSSKGRTIGKVYKLCEVLCFLVKILCLFVRCMLSCLFVRSLRVL